METLYGYRGQVTARTPSETIHIDTAQDNGCLNKVWNRILAFGKAADGLNEETRNQLRMVQQEIPFQYVRFHGILSDEMRIYHEDEDGIPYYNFNYADELLDFLQEIGLKPFMELGFMPDKLSAERKYMFAWRANIGKPKDIIKWENLIQAFLLHLITRYGRDEVRTWYFEIWNDPDLISKLDPSPEKSGYPFLKSTYESIKKVDRELTVGGMNTFAVLMTPEIVRAYMQYIKRETIKLDFLSFSLYGVRNEDAVWKAWEDDALTNHTTDFLLPQRMIGDLYFADIEESGQIFERLGQQIRQYGFQGELIINEWNLVPDPREVINDTCFKGAYFAAGMLQISRQADAAAYWTFSDIFEEVAFKEELFHGGIGFITRNGLKKPVYYVYELMNMLRDTVAAWGDCFVATKSEDGSVTVLLFNYCRLKNYQFRQIEKEDRYHYFEEADKEVLLKLKGMNGYYIRNTYRVNREEGSVYDAWIRMGAPRSLKPDGLRFLKNKSLYHFDTREVYLTDLAVVPVHLESHEVMLMEWLPVR